MRTRLVVLLLLSMSFSVVSIFPEAASATTLYVGGSDPGNYTTIQGAIDYASPGDTVYVYSGTYEELVHVNKTLSLVGVSREDVVVDANTSAVEPALRVTADGVTVSQLSITNTGGPTGWGIPHVGVELSCTDGCIFHDCHVFDVQIGVSMQQAHGSTISNNLFSNNSWGAISVSYSHGNQIADNVVSESGSDAGILLIYSHANTVSGNNVSSYFSGIKLIHADNNTILDNEIQVSHHPDIWLQESRNNSMKRNRMIGGGIHIVGGLLEHWNTHSINSSNSLNGKPVYYFTNAYIDDIPTDAGQVILSNYTGASIRHLNIDDGYVGISMAFSSQLWILMNNISSRKYGIRLQNSSDIIIANNQVQGDWWGIYLLSSSRVTVMNNDVSDSRVGVGLYDSIDNSIMNNSIMNNSDGVVLGSSINNSVYHNNFIDNTHQAKDDGSNQWDNGQSSGGNYWSDYTGGGTGYAIFGGMNYDRYPLTGPLDLPVNLFPECLIQGPGQQSNLSSIIMIRGSAYDLDGSIEWVEVRIDDGPWIEADLNLTWSLSWDTTTVSNGEHTIFARAYDGMDYSAEVGVVVIVDNPHERGDPLLGQIFFWTLVALVIVIMASAGLILEARRRKK